MRNAKLTILAALSLVTLAVLAFGYVGWLALDIVYISVTPNGKTSRDLGVGLSRGEFSVAWNRSEIPQSDALTPGLHVLPVHRFIPSLARDSLWGFQVVRMNAPGNIGVGLICPLWFAALPFTIAPIAWLRRRRRREARGFAIEGSEPVSEGGETQSERQTPTGV